MTKLDARMDAAVAAAGCPKCKDGGTDRVDITVDEDSPLIRLFCMKCEYKWIHETDSEFMQLADAIMESKLEPPPKPVDVFKPYYDGPWFWAITRALEESDPGRFPNGISGGWIIQCATADGFMLKVEHSKNDDGVYETFMAIAIVKKEHFEEPTPSQSTPEELRKAVIQHRIDGGFGDGQERDYAESGGCSFGKEVSLMTTDELLEELGYDSYYGWENDQ